MKYSSNNGGLISKSGTQEIRNFVFEKIEIGRQQETENCGIAVKFGVIWLNS
jgi:hypothetical protein